MKALFAAWIVAWPCKMVAASSSNRNSNTFRGQPHHQPAHINMIGSDATQLVPAAMDLPAQIAKLQGPASSDISMLNSARKGHERFLSSLGLNMDRPGRPTEHSGFVHHATKPVAPVHPERFHNVPSAADPRIANPTKFAPGILNSAETTMNMQLDIPSTQNFMTSPLAMGINSLTLGASSMENAVAHSMQSAMAGAEMQQQRQQATMDHAEPTSAPSQNAVFPEEIDEQRIHDEQPYRPETVEDDEFINSGSLGPQRSQPVQHQSMHDSTLTFEDQQGDAVEEASTFDDSMDTFEPLHDAQEHPTIMPAPIAEHEIEEDVREEPRVSALAGLTHRGGSVDDVQEFENETPSTPISFQSEEDEIGKKLDTFIVPMLWLLMLAAAGVLVAMIVAQRLNEKDEKHKNQMTTGFQKGEVQSLIIAAKKANNHGAMLAGRSDATGFKLVETLKVPDL